MVIAVCSFWAISYYDPSIGRFLSSDPAKAGTNWYAYCDNNPLRSIDPTGLKPSTTWWQWAQDGGTAIAVGGTAIGVVGILVPEPGPSKVVAVTGGVIAVIGGVIWIVGKLGEYADPGTPAPISVPSPVTPTPPSFPPPAYNPPVATPTPPPPMQAIGVRRGIPEPPYQGGSGGDWKDPERFLPSGGMGGGLMK